MKKIKGKKIFKNLSVNVGQASSKYLTEDVLVPVNPILSNTNENTRHASPVSAADCGKYNLINARH